MHKLLERQMKRAFASGVPPGLDRLLADVDAAYQAADADHAMVERSLELMSAELSERNQQLRRDIDEQRRIQAELRRHEDEFRDLIERVPQVIMVRRGAQFVFLNRAALESLGRSSVAELADLRVIDLIHPDDRELVARRIKATDETGVFTGPTEFRMLRTDGEVVTLELGLSRVVVFDGQPAVLLAANDVTDRKRLESRLHIADRMASVGTLAAGVAHEINNPLAYVLSNIDYAVERIVGDTLHALGPEGEELRQALGEAQHGARRVREIVKGLKIFSRADEDTRGPLDLAAVLDSSISIAGNEIRHRARLTKAYSKVPLVVGNSGRLGQVFVNILVNAAQAMPDGAADQNEINVGLNDRDGFVVVTIKDTGCGIPPEVQKRIFDPFFTTKPIGVGTGLGLAICHGIVTTHHGEIGVESQPGSGTTFTLRFPAAPKEPTAHQADVVAPHAATTRRRILVIDDEPLVGRSVRRTLSDHEVLVATNGREALARFAAGEHFDCVICDLMMPEMNGMELHAELLRGWPQVARRMVFLTGGAFSSSARAFLDDVTNLRLSKPFDANELRDAVAVAT